MSTNNYSNSSRSSVLCVFVDEKLHECGFCKRSFKQAAHLKYHLHSHLKQLSGSGDIGDVDPSLLGNMAAFDTRHLASTSPQPLTTAMAPMTSSTMAASSSCGVNGKQHQANLLSQTPPAPVAGAHRSHHSTKHRQSVEAVNGGARRQNGIAGRRRRAAKLDKQSVHGNGQRNGMKRKRRRRDDCEDDEDHEDEDEQEEEDDEDEDEDGVDEDEEEEDDEEEDDDEEDEDEEEDDDDEFDEEDDDDEFDEEEEEEDRAPMIKKNAIEIENGHETTDSVDHDNVDVGGVGDEETPIQQQQQQQQQQQPQMSMNSTSSSGYMMDDECDDEEEDEDEEEEEEDDEEEEEAEVDELLHEDSEATTRRLRRADGEEEVMIDHTAVAAATADAVADVAEDFHEEGLDDDEEQASSSSTAPQGGQSGDDQVDS